MGVRCSTIERPVIRAPILGDSEFTPGWMHGSGRRSEGCLVSGRPRTPRFRLTARTIAQSCRKAFLVSRVYPSATEKNYLKLKELYDLDLAVRVARGYIDAAISSPRDTVVTGWSISCLPSTAGGGRIFTLNVGALEGAYMWKIVDNGVLDGYGITVYVDRRTLETESGLTIDELNTRFGGEVLIEVATHAKFNGRAASVSAEVFGAGTALLDELPWKRAAAALADQLLAESDCKYANYHNSRLAEHILADTK